MILQSWLPPRIVRALSEVDWDRALIFVRALIAIGFFFYPVWWAHLHLTSAAVSNVPLSLAISFLGVQFAVIVSELMASCAVKKLEEIRVRRSERLRPLIQRALGAYLAGKDVLAELERFRKRRARETETCLMEMLAAVNGQTRQRLSELAVSLRLIKRWEHRAKRSRHELNETIEWLGLLSPEIGAPPLRRVLRAARYSLESRWLPKTPSPAALGSKLCSQLRLANEADAGDLCQEILNAPRLVRIMAAADLRNQSTGAGAAAISRALSSTDAAQAAVVLELAESWRRSVSAPELALLLQHDSPQVRSLALKLIPFQGAPASFETEIVNHLRKGLRAGPGGTAAPEVVAGALSAVARLRITRALPYVAECASNSNASLARLACFTLAALGEDGQAVLKGQIHMGPRQHAACAAESLMSLRAGRLAAAGF